MTTDESIKRTEWSPERVSHEQLPLDKGARAWGQQESPMQERQFSTTP